MQFFRTIISLIYVFIFMIESLFLLPYERFLHKKDEKRAKFFCQNTIKRGLSRLTFIAGVKTTCFGKENIPKDEAVLFVGNHRSYYDIICHFPHFPFHTCIVSKIGLKKAPIISTWMIRSGCIFLDNKDIRSGARMLLDGIERIKEGSNVLIFPEGLRHKEDGFAPFHAGSFKLATKPKVKIVPFVQTNTREIWECQWPWLRPQNTTITFLPPVDTKDLTKEELKELPNKIYTDMLNAYNLAKK